MWFPRFPAPRLPSLPSLCAVCHGWGRQRVCTACLQRHAPPTVRCGRCALEVPPGVRTCGNCLVTPPPFDRALAAVGYVHPWSDLVLQLKFSAALDLSHSLADLLADAALARAQPLPELLLPMPLSLPRLRQRGFNQAWELCRHLGPALSVPVAPDLLQRVRDTPHQLAFPVEGRAANVAKAFAPDPSRTGRLAGRHVAVVDDVMTTGATGAEAARALRQAGARRIEVWAVARTPRQGDNPAPCSTSSSSIPKSRPTPAT